MNPRIFVRAAVSGVTLALACSSAQTITQTGPGTYRIRCEASLAECLGQLERLCRDGFELESAKETRQRSGVDAIGTGVEQLETSEAKVVCLSEPLIAGETRLARRSFCTPGETQSCVGPGGCRGGQACLADGGGYAACDCAEPPETSVQAVPSSGSQDPGMPAPTATASATNSPAPATSAAPAASSPGVVPRAAPSATVP